VYISAAGGDVDETDKAGTFRSVTVSSFVRSRGLLAGINALPFYPSSDREGEPRTNTGLVISDGVMLSPPHTAFDALVFYPDGSAAIVPQSRVKSADGIANAVGGFYRVLEGGCLTERAANGKERHPRSAVGICAGGRYLYLLVIDGRRPGSAGSTEAETAVILKRLGASEGLNFDGGGSSALALRYPDGHIRVANTPVHSGIPGRERAVAGCLGVGVRKENRE
jgi:exopolysaccharide biosynthesis protein